MKTTHDQDVHDHRILQRNLAELRTIVQVKERGDNSWKEVTKVSTVSRNGAGFRLTRKCTVGRLVSLVLPLPTALRAYDHNTEVYPVLGLVQYCNASEIDGETAYHVGVAFVGKTIPDSFKEDPRQTYRITGLNSDGLWMITEAKTPFTMRKNQRYSIPLEVTVTLMKSKDKTISKEATLTRDISLTGLAVQCSLDAVEGDRVKIACKEHNFYAIAIVRNRSAVNGQNPTLHLEFLEGTFPMEKLYAAEAAASAEKLASLEASKVAVKEARPENIPLPPVDTSQFEFHRY